MKIEDLEKANNLKDEIEFIKRQIDYCKYTQSKNVVERESYLDFFGNPTKIVIPETLFKKVGKLILTEYSALLVVKELELNNLVK